MLPFLRIAALCLHPLVLSLQCYVPLGECTEEAQPGWLGRWVELMQVLLEWKQHGQ